MSSTNNSSYKTLVKKNYDNLFKLVIIGDSGVGKSCILTRFADDTFTESFISTIGVDFRFKTITIENPITNKSTVIKLQIWDTAGQERFRNIASSYYRSSDGLIVVYDISNKQSFTNVTYWIEEALKYITSEIPIMIIGNKSDRLDREVTFEELKNFAEKNKLFYMESSARENINIDNIFQELAKQCLDNLTMIYQEKDNNINLYDENQIKNTKKCC